MVSLSSPGQLSELRTEAGQRGPSAVRRIAGYVFSLLLLLLLLVVVVVVVGWSLVLGSCCSDWVLSVGAPLLSGLSVIFSSSAHVTVTIPTYPHWLQSPPGLAHSNRCLSPCRAASSHHQHQHQAVISSDLAPPFSSSPSSVLKLRGTWPLIG